MKITVKQIHKYGGWPQQANYNIAREEWEWHFYKSDEKKLPQEVWEYWDKSTKSHVEYMAYRTNTPLDEACLKALRAFKDDFGKAYRRYAEPCYTMSYSYDIDMAEENEEEEE